MASFAITEQAESDVSDILEHTLEGWGEQKYDEYCNLLEEAFTAIAQDPDLGTRREDVRAGVRGHHIKQPGRNARHIVFYMYEPTADRVVVLRVLHDAMDFARHLPE